MIEHLPILGICGFSGSGKTTLIEQLIPPLTADGLSVVVVKHDAHGLDVDRPGKNSDRLFRAGADVVLQGPEQEFFRRHGRDGELAPALASLAGRYDLVLVEGHKRTPLPKLWLLDDDQSGPPEGVGNVLAVLTKDVGRLEAAAPIVDKFLIARWLATPVFGCVLIGGKSVRMGAPKHLLTGGGRTWLERTVELLDDCCETVVISGAGDVPASLADRVQLPDIADAQGPIAGLLSAMRWGPNASWLVAACDLPDLSAEALAWLLANRRPGAWASLPALTDAGRVEPLLAHYDFRARGVLEDIAERGESSLQPAAAHPKVISLRVPDALAPAWRNVNRPESR